MLLVHKSKRWTLHFCKEEIVSTIRNNGEYVGEQDAQELAQVLLDANTRNVAKIVVENEEAAAELIEMLLGPSVPPRREYLLKHSEEARD